MTGVILQSELICPQCGYKKIEMMPTDTCQWYYECECCHAILTPEVGECCVFCSFGSVPCPPMQHSIKAKGNCD